MPVGNFDPISPASKDCIICMARNHEIEHFYSPEESNLSVLLSLYTKKFKEIHGARPVKVAIYYVDKIEATRLFGIDQLPQE
jgi:hypothetical protein